MRLGRNQFSLAVTGAGLWLLSCLAQAQESDIYKRVEDSELTAAFRKLKRNDSLQFDLPDAPPPPKRSPWAEAIGEFIAALFKLLAPILQFVFWVGLGAIAAGAIYLIAQTIYEASKASRAKNKTKDAPAPPPLYEPEHQRARILLDEIDALAAQGKYDEAVHTLLHRSIQDIDANRPNVIRRSLTSREIGELSILTEKAQDAFSQIAKIVEHSFFGGNPIGRAEFDEARAAYATLALGEQADRLMAA